MNTSQIYILLSILAMALVALFVFVINRNKTGKEKNLTPLAGLAFAFILAGLFFGDNRFISYSFMGVGMVLATIDMVNKLKKK